MIYNSINANVIRLKVDTLNIVDRRVKERRTGERRATKSGTEQRQHPRIRQIQLPAITRNIQDRRSEFKNRRIGSILPASIFLTVCDKP